MPRKPKGTIKPYVRVTQEIKDMICDQLTLGRTLTSILRDTPHAPSFRAVTKALRADADFAAEYALAREMGREHMNEHIIDLADNAEVSKEAVAKATLQVAVRERYLARMAPKKYGPPALVSEAQQAATPPPPITLVGLADPPEPEMPGGGE